MKLIDKYAEFVSKHPIQVLIFVALISAVLFYFAASIKTTNMEYQDILPDGYEAISAWKVISEEFGGSEQVEIVVELDPDGVTSRYISDIRDYEIISYINKLTKKAEYLSYVESSSSIATVILDANGDYIPDNNLEIKEILSNSTVVSSSKKYLSSDNSMTLVKVSLMEDAKNKDEQTLNEFNNLVDSIPIPSGVKVSVIGTTIKGPILKGLISPDMNKTSVIAIIGILIILIFMFRSVKYSTLPLASILFGVPWALGFVSLIGLGLSSTTSGAISMIMGIGIDFGIQIISRFRYELKLFNKQEAMQKTISATLFPMITTTLATLIGFQVMRFGELSIMSELGTIMSYGTVFCMFAAVTAVPALLLVLEKDKKKQN